MLAVSCGYALQYVGFVITDGIMCTGHVFSRQHVKLRLHCMYSWAPLQLERAGCPIGPLQCRAVFCRRSSSMLNVPCGYVLQCVGTAFAKWQLLCGLFLC